MKATDMLNKVKELVGVEASEEVKLAQATLENGTVIESEDFAVGSEVFIVTDDEKVALPVGDYTLEDGEQLKVEEEGVIASIGAAEEPTEEPAEEEASEELEEEEMAYATKEELAEVKSMIEDIKAMIEKKDEMSEEVKEDKEELSEVEEVEEKVELEKVTHNPEAEAQKEIKLFGQKRQPTTMDRVFSRISNIKNK
jgi:phosphoglycolate phosphatase-like HAD superfamily hydrolase